jgi:diguanylate cyclase (GGDEF)-like protein
VRSRVPAWTWPFAVGGLCAVAFLLFSNPWVKASVQVPVYVATAALFVRAWWRGRARSPDALRTLAVVAFSVYFCASVLGVVVPLTATDSSSVSVPSPLDGLFLLSYLLLACFLWRLGSRSAAPGRSDLLDTLIVVGGLLPVFWLLLISPLLGSDELSAALVTYIAYPVIVFALLGMMIRLALVSGQRTMPHLLLGGWIVFELSADIVFLYAGVEGTYVYGQPWQVMWIVSATFLAALALHPRTGVLLERRTVRPVKGTRRLYLLAASLAVPIVTILWTDLREHGDRTVLVSVTVALILVVLLSLRLSGLMVDNAAQLRVQVELQHLTDDLAHQALHDPLTGLGNRVLFAERADYALAQRVTESSRAAAMLLLDLDDFKTVNDTFGHEAGDRVLIEVSRRLECVTRHGEGVFRLGGDEFAFVLAHARLSDALRLADRITAALAHPYDLGPRQIYPVASIGIAIALDGQDRSTLLAQADMAMYDGKSRTSTLPAVYDPVLHHQSLERHQLERDLREAVGRGELRVLYQPLVHLASNDMVGVEALLRWEHPTRGTVSPLEFIPLAETNGAILEIGDWVLEEALRQLRIWDLTRGDGRLYISVNVSPRQLADPEFVARVGAVLARSGLDPSRVNLEITERAFGVDAEDMILRLHELKDLGVSLAIDDFGTDYSSLSHLRRLPVDILKIDKSFVSGIASEPAEWALTAAIIRLAAGLDKTTVAEGIETGGQLAHLRSLHVELGQGYLFAPPLPPEEITALLDVAPGQAFLAAEPV